MKKKMKMRKGADEPIKNSHMMSSTTHIAMFQKHTCNGVGLIKANPSILTRDECRSVHKSNVNLSVRRARRGGGRGSVRISRGSFHYHYVISAHTHHDALAPSRTGEVGEGKQ